MDYVKYIILGVIQGLTEFLPISSSGHIVLGQYLLKFDRQGILLEVILHLGTLLSIIIFYRSEITSLLKGIVKKNNDQIYYMIMILVSTMPAILCGLMYKANIESLFLPKYISYMFLFSGLILLLTKFIYYDTHQKITLKSAIIIGFFQALAMIPGISRSGMTISLALLLGIDRSEAAKFSFFMAIPILLGAGIYEISDITIESFEILPLIIGFVFSFLSGIIVIKFLVKIISDNNFWKFSLYCFWIGLTCIYFGLGS